MKKLLSTILSVIMIATILPMGMFTVTASGSSNFLETADGIGYTVSNEEVTICYYSGTETELVIPPEIDGYPVTTVGGYAFERGGNDEYITSITLPDTVIYIGEFAFCSCERLEKLVLPYVGICEDVYIDLDNAFGWGGVRDTLKEIVVTKEVGAYAFSGAGLTSIVLGENVERIGDYAFSDVNISKIEIPINIKAIEPYAFSGCESLEYNVYKKGKYLGNANNPYLVLVDNDISLFNDSFEFADGVKFIHGNAFKGCTNIKYITIPDTVVSIGTDAFEGCTGLTEVNINSLEAWCRIEFGNVNSNPLSLAGTLKVNYQTIGTELVVPGTIKSINSYAFYGMKDLTRVKLGNVENISSYAFKNCKGLTQIEIPDTVIEIGFGAFRDCIGLKNVTFGNNLNTIGIYAFSGCTGLTEIAIPDSVVTIKDYAFYDCDNIERIVLGNGLSEVYYKAFGIDNVIDLYISDLEVWSNIYFEGDEYSGHVFETGYNLYLDGKSVTNIVIPDNVSEIVYFSFASCYNLKEVNIPDSVVEIKRDAFNGCKGLESVIVPDGIYFIGDRAFKDCDNLSNIWYEGSYDDREDIYIGTDNDYLVNATWHLNTCKGGKHSYSGCSDVKCNKCEWTRTPLAHRYDNNADTTCNDCGAFAYPGGNTLYKENGVWYHVVNRQKVTDTTMVKFSGSWYYVTSGKVASAYTGLVKYSGSWYYVQNGKMPTSYTGLVKHSGSWYYVQNSKMAASFTGLVKHSGSWYYVQNGKMPASYTGLVKHSGSWYYVQNGKMPASYTGLVKHSGSWYYVQNGKMPTSYNNLVKYNGSWYLVQGSKVNFTYKGLYKYNGSWYYVADGKINFSYSGKVLYSGKYYTVKNGVKV